MSLKNEIVQVFDTSATIGLRLFLVNAPVIGPSLDVIATEVFQARKDNFINNTLEKLDKNKIDIEYLESIEFKNILIRTVELVIKEIYEEKIEFYSNIIKNTLESSPEDRKYNFDYVQAFSELSIEQVYILIELYTIQKETIFEDRGSTLSIMLKDDVWDNFILKLNEKYCIEETEVNFLLKRTEKSGLIYEITGAYFDYGGGIYKLDKSFPKLMEKLGIII